MKYTLINRNKSTSANDHSEFVRWMRKNDIQHFSENNEFMEAYSFRKSTFENIHLRFESEETFVEDLVKNELLSIEDQKKTWNFFKK